MGLITRGRVLDALEALGGQVGQPSVSAVAKHAGVSRPTARKWMNQFAATHPQSTTDKVENTVAIRKGDIGYASGQQWGGMVAAPGVKALGLAYDLMQGMNYGAGDPTELGQVNTPFQPLGRRKDGSEEERVYRHPFDSGLVLTQSGETVGAHNAKLGLQFSERAPISVLDLAGFLEDSTDEYAPPIGETDHQGRIRYSEDYHAPNRVGLGTKEWSDNDVDWYLCNVLNA